MTPLTFKEASNVVNSIEWGCPKKSSLPEDHFTKAEEMGLITTEHDQVFTKYITTDKALPLIVD